MTLQQAFQDLPVDARDEQWVDAAFGCLKKWAMANVAMGNDVRIEMPLDSCWEKAMIIAIPMDKQKAEAQYRKHYRIKQEVSK